ncbi:MAG: hypothetical protein WC516_05355 [Patescibacteria group bacterium]
MKRLILSLLCVILLGGCLYEVKHDYSSIKEDVFLDPYYVWSYSPVQEMFNKNVSPLRAITLRVLNKKYCDVEVTVTCRFQPEDVFFGVNTIMVDVRGDKVFTVKGFARGTPDVETVRCQITRVKYVF